MRTTRVAANFLELTRRRYGLLGFGGGLITAAIASRAMGTTALVVSGIALCGLTLAYYRIHPDYYHEGNLADTV